MASCCFPDIWSWIHDLPPITQWRKNSIFLCICSSSKSSQPSLNLSINKDLQNSSFSFSVIADFKLPISLWTSRSLQLKSKTPRLLEEETISCLFSNIISDVLSYGPCKNTSSHRIPSVRDKDAFNVAFLTLVLLICIYEAPQDLRSGCLNILKNHLISPNTIEASKRLVRLLGSNIEEQWMKSLNLAVTNWIVEIQASTPILRMPLPLFSYSVSTFGLWKVQLYCPVIAMKTENLSNSPADEQLQFSLQYQQLEGVIQFSYKVTCREKWVDVMVKVDNIRCDVVPLVSETLMAERGAGAAEKHFPSRICLQLTPTLQTNVLSVSVGKSSENPTWEIGSQKAIEGSFDPPNTYLGLKVSASETVTMNLKPWKFEQSIHGDTANLNWFLHDSMDGREVFSSKPSKISLIQPKSWFKNRYSSAYRPFTKQGGVIFAGDEYGDGVWWKLDKGAMEKALEWKIKGSIWLTYWPNKYKTFYNETRRLEFRETLHLLPA